MIFSWRLLFFMAWHDALLCLLLCRKRLQTVCAILDTALRTFMAFAYIFVRLLFTLCIFWGCVRLRFFCTLCGFCVRIQPLILRTLCSFCVRIRLLWAMCGFLYIYDFYSWCSMWTVSRYPILKVLLIYFVRANCLFNVDSLEVSDLEGFLDFFCPCELLVIHCPNSSEVSFLVEKYYCALCCYVVPI